MHRRQAVARAMQQQHHQHAENDDLVVACLLKKLRQQILEPFLEQGEQRGTDDRAPDMARAANHRHEQVVDSGVDAKRVRAHEAQEVRVEPARCAGQERRVQKHDDLEVRGVHAIALGHDAAETKCANGAPGARIEQIARRNQRNQRYDPDQVIGLAAGIERPAEHGNRGNVVQAAVLAEHLEVAENVIDGNAPGDGAYRKIVTREPQRDEPQGQGDGRGERQPREQGDPGGYAVRDREHSGGVGGHAHEGLLPEGHDADDAGEQHQPEGHQCRQADVVHQRDIELRHHERRNRYKNEEQRQRGARRHHSSSSSTWRVVSERQTSTGMMMVKTMLSFSVRAQKEEKDSSRPTPTAPIAASG